MGLQFGMSTIQSGKRVSNINTDPTLTVSSTKGRFAITGTVSRIMGIIPGDHVQFISTIPAIDISIAERDAEVIAWCEANNIEFGTEEARAALIQEFGRYAICKGVPMYDKDGNRKQVGVRMTAEQKAAGFELNKETLAEMLDKSVEEVTIDDFEPTTDGFTGSKTSTTSNLTGIGLPLAFSDSAIWAEMKEDLGEEGETYNRVYGVDLKAPFEHAVENGKPGDEGYTKVTAYPLTFEKDEKAGRREASK